MPRDTSPPPSQPALQREFLTLLIEHGEGLRKGQRQPDKRHASHAILTTLRKLHAELKG